MHGNYTTCTQKDMAHNENTNKEFPQKEKPVQVEAISSSPVNHSFLLQQTVAFEEQHFSSSLLVAPREISQKTRKINKNEKTSLL